MKFYATEADGPPPGDPSTYHELQIDLAGKTTDADVTTAMLQSVLPGLYPGHGFDSVNSALSDWARGLAGKVKVVVITGLGDVMRADPVLAMQAVTVVEGAGLDAFRTLCEEDRCSEAKTELYQTFAFLD